MPFKAPYSVIRWHNCWAVIDARRRIVAHDQNEQAMRKMAQAGNEKQERKDK